MPEAAATAGPELQLDLQQPEQHLVRCRLRFTPRTHRLGFRLPSWTPGSYLIRDYVRHLEGLEVWQDGRRVALEGAAPTGWHLQLETLAPVEIRYRILATDLSVRTCHLNGDHGFLALAGVALQLEGERWNPHGLELLLPPEWQPFVPLEEAGPMRWQTRDFDQLVDTPLEVGPHPGHAFSVAGVPHRWVSWGGDLPSLDPAWLRDVERVCLACCRLMGATAPAAPSYLFVLHLTDQGYGGLEHDRSSVLLYGRRTLAKREGRRKLLQLVAHEYLHQWNVRRLRPVEITPIDYDRATAIPSLWFAEGVTSYYDQLLPVAAGIVSESELLEDLGADLSRFLLTPGRRVQSLRQSSEEAWVKLYKQDAYSGDSQISYYLKGAVVALVLDLHLRREQSSLSRVLQDLWHHFGRWGRGYRERDLIEAFTSHSHDLSTLLPEWLESTDDPPVDDHLADVGLRLLPERSDQVSLGWTIAELPGGMTGLRQVRRHGPAEISGLQVGDEILAIDGQRLAAPGDLPTMTTLTCKPSPLKPTTDPGVHEVLFCRDGRIRTARVTSGEPEIVRWRLESDPEAPRAAIDRRARWLTLTP